MSGAALPVVEGDAGLAETRLAELPLVKRRLRIDTIGPAYYTVADGDGQT